MTLTDWTITSEAQVDGISYVTAFLTEAQDHAQVMEHDRNIKQIYAAESHCYGLRFGGQGTVSKGTRRANRGNLIRQCWNAAEGRMFMLLI
jgi:hypothetical protein